MSKENRGEIIESIRKRKKEVVITFESGDKLSLSPFTFTEFRLYEGKQLSEQEYLNLISSKKEEGYMEYALRLLSRENYSSYVLYGKILDRGANVELAQKIIDKLTKEGLLDDKMYAKTYAEDVAELRLYGRNKVLFNLHQKGISNEIIDNLSFPREKELEKALNYVKVLDRRLLKAPKKKKVGKTLLALRERGFDLDVAKEATNQALSFPSEEENKSNLESDYLIAKTRYERKYSGYKLSRAIFSYLLRKGYEYDDISNLVKGENDENN